jgi:hypothetical protein
MSAYGRKQMKKRLSLKSKMLEGQNISYRIFGNGDIDLVIKLIMRKAPPFYYYDQFSPEAKKYILDELTKAELHDVALEEYRLAHEEKEICQLKEKGDFPKIPIVLITHESEFEIKEIMEFGQTTKEFAVKVEELWQSLMQEYLTFSDQSILLRANNSGHYIHLTDFEVIKQALQCI